MLKNFKLITQFCSNPQQQKLSSNIDNYQSITGQLAGKENKDIKEQYDKFRSIYSRFNVKQVHEQQKLQKLNDLQKIEQQFNQVNQQQQFEQKNIENKKHFSWYIPFMSIFGACMLIQLSKATYEFYSNPNQVILYDQNTGKTFNTTREKFEEIKAESKKNKEFNEFRIKILSRQQAQQQQIDQKEQYHQQKRKAKLEGEII